MLANCAYIWIRKSWRTSTFHVVYLFTVPVVYNECFCDKKRKEKRLLSLDRPHWVFQESRWVLAVVQLPGLGFKALPCDLTAVSPWANLNLPEPISLMKEAVMRVRWETWECTVHSRVLGECRSWGHDNLPVRSEGPCSWGGGLHPAGATS